MNYIDQCLERSKKAVKGPWTERNTQILSADLRPIISCHIACPPDCKPDGHGVCVHLYEYSNQPKNNAEFIAHARTDVPELARRLRQACHFLRCLDCDDIADELEAMPEEKG